MTSQEIISSVKDVVVAAAAAITAIAAVRGLNTWNRQLTGSAAFETARALVRATLKTRDALEGFRSPLIMSHEFPEGYRDIQANYPEGHARNQAYAEAWRQMYNKRWEPVLAAVREFDSVSLEAEALWGARSREATNKLRGHIWEIYTAVDAVIEDKQSGGEIFTGDKAFGKKMRAVVSASPRSMDNELTKAIAAAVADIENLVKAHLRRDE